MSRTSVRVLLVLAGMTTLGLGLLLAAGGTIYQAYQTPPIQLGTSGGNVNDISAMYCCSGTLGSLVAKGGTQYILSNNHVLARSDQGKAGDDISQPGLVDTGCGTGAHNTVANLSSFVTLGSKNVDAAIAQVAPGMVDTSGSILTVGVPASTPATPALNMGVAKSGRTSGFTCATIGSVNTSVSVQYDTQCGGGSTYIITYANQVVINSHSFSAGGDSGSLIVASASAQPVALLFAGSSTTTIGNPIGDVANALGVSFVGGGTHSVACSTGHGKKPKSGKLALAHAAKEKHVAQLMQDPAVMAVGVGVDDVDETEPVVVIYVEQGRAVGQIPAELDGVKTKVVRTDRIRAYGWNEKTTSRCAK